MKFAITGTIGSGKSTVSILFKRMNIPIVDCDGYSKLCLMDHHPCCKKIKDTFGSEVLDENGYLDRAKIASVIFNDEEKRKLLNEIMHPAIKEGMLNFFDKHQDVPIIGAEVPLLFECKWEDLFDEVIVVTCDDEVAINRLMEYREFSRGDAEARLKTQINKDEQIQKADYVLYNYGSLKDLNKEVLEWLREKRNGVKN